MTWALPNSCKDLLDAVNIADRHPGLQLDKFSDGGSQRDQQRPALDLVAKTEGNEDALHAFGERRRNMLRAVLAQQFSAKTMGPVTLHLSRASALENAGICLHPLLGFVYLPGSGLKGMARAWAETAWLAEQTDKNVGTAQIERVFGSQNRAGSVVFHDAWPQTWPKLIVDILNNHHRDYYHGAGQPGDWEDPVPVNFLAVEKGQAFDFALSLRHGCTDDIELLALAQQWLHAALCLRGAGAKTNAGYGAFAPAPELEQPVLPQHEACFAARLTLTSPGFFAGAQQDGTDCDLRPASLRGQLRWWWRALHAGFLPLADLKSLEALLWGSTERSGMLRISLDANMMNTRAMPYNRQREILGLPKPPAKTVQGLHYVTYGMNDGGNNRSLAKPGSSWDLTITARSTGANISVQQALRHAQASVWLFTHYGGLGSKARKGFGSFADVDVDSLQRFQHQFIGLYIRIIAIWQRSGRKP